MSSPRWSNATKHALCDALEEVSASGDPPERKRDRVLPHLYKHAVTLAEEKAVGLAPTAREDLVSAVGERAATALERLETEAPPAQQAAYLDRVLHHALADAGRSADPLGRGPRRLRRQYEARCEAASRSCGGAVPKQAQDEILDEIVGQGKPALRLMVGHGMPPGEAAACLGSGGDQARDPAETVVLASVRHQVARAIAAHPDPAVREYLFMVAAGLSAKRPKHFHARLGPALPELIGDLLMEKNCG